MKNPNVKGMVRKIGTTTTGNLRDTDKDGVPNVIDCKPYNPKEQGILHKAGSWIARKAGAERTAERIEKRGEYVDEMKEEAREAAKEERKKQYVKTSVYRETQAGERRRKYIKSGGFFGQMGKGFGETRKAIVGKPQKRRKGAKKIYVQVGTKPKRKRAKKSKKDDVFGGVPNISKLKFKF